MTTKEVIIKADQSFMKHCAESLKGFMIKTIKKGRYSRHILKSSPFEKKPIRICDSQANEFVIHLLAFDKKMESIEIITQMARKKFWPLGLERFFILGRKRSELLQEDRPIVTFGRIWEKHLGLFVPCFWGEFRTFPDIWFYNEPWLAGKCWFAASKVS